MKHLLILILLLVQASEVKPQELKKNKDYYVAAIGFWNLENLYDTLDDRWKNDEDFTPEGTKAWTGERYRKKLENLSEAIEKMATEYTADGLAVLGLCETENRKVVEDLVNTEALRSRQYQVIHVEGPDARGVDPSFVYNPRYFKPLHYCAYPVKVITDPLHKTRDILVLSGTFLGEPMAFLVNHWPSRRGGESASRPNRNYAAKLARHIADSIAIQDPGMKILVMGDLNDDPVNESVQNCFGTYANYEHPDSLRYFNPMEQLYKKGIGSLAWQDSWNLFDQMLLNGNLLKGEFLSWEYLGARVFNPRFLRSDLPQDKGYPLRTFSGARYTGGYSDHFPVYILLAKEKAKSPRGPGNRNLAKVR
ncbi:MAG TPA: endonuclease/exonuclease/phosphatase family protein [Bacteroidia bacterium]|nr:endonuclease/exonuclease/phosphatase family protein [Bacteroidia bacterium]